MEHQSVTKTAVLVGDFGWNWRLTLAQTTGEKRSGSWGNVSEISLSAVSETAPKKKATSLPILTQDHSGRDSFFIFLPPKPPGTSLFRDNIALDEIYRKMKMEQLKEEQTENANRLKKQKTRVENVQVFSSARFISLLFQYWRRGGTSFSLSIWSQGAAIFVRFLPMTSRRWLARDVFVQHAGQVYGVTD